MDYYDKYIGQMLDNRYEILERIGTGGMAVVYKARCHRLNRLVAVKILKEEFADDAEFRRRFRTESHAVAMLSHPNIVSVYDVSRTGSTEYIVMELIEGITLKQYINRKGVLNWKESLHFVTQIAKALQHAHSRGIIHRDIKPHNIMILKDGSVKVADFGIARLLSTQNTLTQEALGSVHYISPEQAKGGPVDARTDIYSLGVVLYEMLTSRLPFVGDSAVSIAIQHISAIPLMPREINPDIPAGLEEITMRAMEPDLNKRYASADEMLHDLEEFRKNPATTFRTIPAEHFSDPAVLAQHSGNTGRIQQNTGRIQQEESLSHTDIPAAPKPVRQTQKMTKPGMTTDEYRRNRRRASRTSTLIGVFCVLVFLVLAVVFMWRYFLRDMLSPEEHFVTTPNFVGRYYDDVVNSNEFTAIYNFGDPDYEYSEKYDEGQIIDQKPPANRQKSLTEDGIDVELTVSMGKQPDENTMPDILNKDYRLANIQLQNLGLNLDIQIDSEYNEDVTELYVIRQIPERGEKLNEGDTVYIIYSRGPEITKIAMPTVVGYNVNAAIARLESYELSYEVEYEYSEDYSANIVMFQSVEPGDEIAAHTKITIIVSKGPEYVTPSPSPSPSPSQSPSPSPSEEPSPSPSEEPSPSPVEEPSPSPSEEPEPGPEEESSENP